MCMRVYPAVYDELRLGSASITQQNMAYINDTKGNRRLIGDSYEQDYVGFV